jgi:hypothetical protein
MLFDWNRIEPHHVEWIFNAALKELSKQLEEIEIQIVRHRHHPHDPLFTRFGIDNRDDKLEDLGRRMGEMQQLCVFVEELRVAAHKRTSEIDAKELAASLAIEPPKKKQTKSATRKAVKRRASKGGA